MSACWVTEAGGARCPGDAGFLCDEAQGSKEAVGSFPVLPSYLHQGLPTVCIPSDISIKT